MCSRWEKSLRIFEPTPWWFIAKLIWKKRQIEYRAGSNIHSMPCTHVFTLFLPPSVSFNEKKWTVKAFRCFFFGALSPSPLLWLIWSKNSCFIAPFFFAPPSSVAWFTIDDDRVRERARERTHRIRGIFIIKFTFNCSLLEKKSKNSRKLSTVSSSKAGEFTRPKNNSALLNDSTN